MATLGARRQLAGALMVALAPWCAGCGTAIHLTRGDDVHDENAGALEVRVYDNGSGQRHDVTTRKRVVTELYRREGATATLVRHEETAQWTADDLPPGRYELRVDHWVDDDGAVHALDHPCQRKLKIRAGRTARADVVLSDTTKVWGVATVVTVVGGLIAVLVSNGFPLGEGWTW